MWKQGNLRKTDKSKHLYICIKESNQNSFNHAKKKTLFILYVIIYKSHNSHRHKKTHYPNPAYSYEIKSCKCRYIHIYIYIHNYRIFPSRVGWFDANLK